MTSETPLFKKMTRIPTKREWYVCRVCGQRLAIVDDTAECHGVYIKCKNCKNEIEIRIAH